MWSRREIETEDCSECGATGHVTCSSCHGDYKYQNEHGTWLTCHDCSRGKIKCWVCHGRGQRHIEERYCNSCNRAVHFAVSCCSYCGAD